MSNNEFLGGFIPKKLQIWTHYIINSFLFTFCLRVCLSHIYVYFYSQK